MVTKEIKDKLKEHKQRIERLEFLMKGRETLKQKNERKTLICLCCKKKMRLAYVCPRSEVITALQKEALLTWEKEVNGR